MNLNLKNTAIKRLLISLAFFLSLSVFSSGIDSYTKLMLHNDDVGLIDSSASAHTVTLNGNAARSNTQSKFGGYSAVFDYIDDWIEVTGTTTDFSYAGDFTIDFWFYATVISNNPYFMDNVTTGNVMSLGCYSTGAIFMYDGSALTGGTALINEWNHFALVRNGTGTNNLKLYLNGTKVAEKSDNSTKGTNEGLKIGIGQNNENDFAGYIDEFRISKGIARWTSDFTPETSAYSSVSIFIAKIIMF